MSDRLLSALRRTQSEMLDSQEQLSTGKTVNRPSDAPAKTAAILLLQRGLSLRAQQDQNLQQAVGTLNNLDQALSDVTKLALEARSVASSQVGVGSNTDTRRNQATVIDAQIKTLIDIANRKSRDVSLFGGSYHPPGAGVVFEEFLGGVRYKGTREALAIDVGLNKPLAFNASGSDAFGALSARVQGRENLSCQATPSTLLRDVAGAQGQGIRRGTLLLGVDSVQVEVDLSSAETMGDVLTRINAAIDQVDSSAGELTLAAQGFAVHANAGHRIQIMDLDTGQTAADLGMDLAADAGGGSDVVQAGTIVHPRVTARSELSALGANVDWTSGMQVTQGHVTKVIDFSTATTVQDLMNLVERQNLGLRMEINQAGTGLNLVSEVSGIEWSVGENGGSTASDLGLRTLGRQTLLSDFRHGLGVEQAQGDDFEIQLHSGMSFRVDLEDALNVGQVLNRIAAAAAAAGLSVGDTGAAGTDFNVGLALTGNGLVLEDHSAGAGAFRVQQVGQSMAAENLGIYTNAQAGSTLTGADRSKVRVENIFTHLLNLRDSLLQDDSPGITLAGGALESDIEGLARTRADAGVRAQRVEQQQERSAGMTITEKSLLSDLQDADLTQVITRYTQLQQQLEASLRVGAQNLQLSLWDFLR